MSNYRCADAASRSLRPLIMLIVMLGTSGCATTGENRVWDRVVAGSRASIKQESVWMPLAAAAAFAATSADNEVAEWAFEEQPVFGSTEGAADASDWLSNGLVAAALVTSYTLRDDSGQPFITDLLAMSSAYAFTAGLKEASGRTRPDGSNDLSFPSLHASSAFSAATILSRNVAAMDVSNEGAIRVSLFTFASASAWARIEAGRHHPADVLAGAAIGNFFAEVANYLVENRNNVTVSFLPIAGGGEFRVHLLFR